ncbi:unnamed protein product [Rhizophagus irregularis]|nr:unnamed protein product [Rhizophagus irregularis]
MSLYLRFERFRYWWNDKYEGKRIHTYHENDSLEWFEKMLSEGENLQEDTSKKDNEIYDSEEEIEIIVEDKREVSEIRIGLRQLIVNQRKARQRNNEIWNKRKIEREYYAITEIRLYDIRENGRCEECNQEIREDEQDELIELRTT